MQLTESLPKRLSTDPQLPEPLELLGDKIGVAAVQIGQFLAIEAVIKRRVLVLQQRREVRP